MDREQILIELFIYMTYVCLIMSPEGHSAKRYVYLVKWVIAILLVAGGTACHHSAAQKGKQEAAHKEQAQGRAVPATEKQTITGTTERIPGPVGMVYVPAGWFWMGCGPKDIQCSDAEKPFHKVYLDAYYIDRDDVTVDEYKRCVEKGGCTEPHWNYCWTWTHGSSWQKRAVGPDFVKGNHPIVCVDWSQANTYCKWSGKTLPTEAQWEKAARGTDGRIYPWGNDWDASKACFDKPSTCPIGNYPEGASPYGVLDMAGNVWDWCADWYNGNYYHTSSDHDPRGATTSSMRVLRGGAWNSADPPDVRTSRRNDEVPGYWQDYYGFRCARRAPE